MLFKRTNIQEKLARVRTKNLGEAKIIEQVEKILARDEASKSQIRYNLHTAGQDVHNDFKFDLLETNRIFHESDIKKICIDYRLRFLDTKYFKGDFPRDVLNEIQHLEKIHKTQISGYKIIAPSKMFRLRKADDPLLFAPLGNGYYYLIKKWGNDLHPLRKWMVWPFKSFENLVVAILLSSLFATLLVPDGLFTKNQSVSQDVMVFFFMFKSIAAVVIFYGFALGKNFNTAIWKSKFDKAQ